MLTNKSFCPYPFKQTVIRTNLRLTPCCHIFSSTQSLDKTTIAEFYSSDDVENMRQRMKQGLPISACRECTASEATTGISVRTSVLDDYNIKSDSDINSFEYNANFPTHVEFHVSNLCNLKCLTCTPRDSSTFLAEDIKLGLTDRRASDYQTNDQLLINTMNDIIDNDVSILDLRGGESLLVPTIKQQLAAAPQEWCNRVELRIQTNGTIFDLEWKRILERFKSVSVMLSIDAYGAANHYIRYPANWNTIEHNVDHFKKLNNLSNLFINCTVSNLNFSILEDLIKWAIKKELYCHFSKLTNPVYYAYDNLPKPLLKRGLKVANEYQTNYNTLAYFNTQTPDQTHWDEFVNNIKMRDKHRGNSVLDVLPGLFDE